MKNEPSYGLTPLIYKQGFIMSDYNNRQYHLMLNQLKNFQAKHIDLKHLINGLESLLGCLEDPAADWKSAFQRQWGILEDVYADAVDKKCLDLPDAHRKLVTVAASNLESMVREALRLSSE
jgi:hypothetical protein